MHLLQKSLVRRVLRKVPEVTIYFWIIKLLSMALGESASDYLVRHINPIVAVLLGAAGLGATLVWQLAVRHYVAWIYWLTVVMVAIFGTMAADVIHIVLGVPYLASTLFFAMVLAVIFVAWYASEKTLSIHSISTSLRELFYWATVMATFALGTAAGDLTAVTFGLGYLVSGMLFAGLFAMPMLGYKFLGLNGVLSFWFAYVVTRPLGASFADWMGRPPGLGGMGMGTGRVAGALTLLIILFVSYMAITYKDISTETVEP